MKSICLPAFAKFQSERRWRWMVQSGVFGLCLVAVFFAHELGHATAVLALGGRVLAINVLGVQWFPTFRFMSEYGYGGYVAWLIPPNNLHTHVIVAAGSTGTLLIALFAALVLNLFRARGLAGTTLVGLSFYFVDSLVHVIPVLGTTSNAAPPWVRNFSEAYYALLDLGIPGGLYITVVFAMTCLILALLVRSIRRSRVVL